MADPHSSRHGPEAANPDMVANHDLEAGWLLVGSDSQGRPVRLLFGETRLRRSYPGLTIGRHPALSDLVVGDPTVSRRHLRIARDGDRLIIEDLNSLNGTLVGGAPLRPFEPVAVGEGAMLEIGLVALQLSSVTPG